MYNPASSMRLTGGHSRGRRLKRPRAAGLRPTPSRVREALFDILGARIAAASFLDVYAGTGAVGIEALSRGASHAVFVEENPSAARLIRANLDLLERPGSGEILTERAESCLAALSRRGARFDIAFLDPPYEAGVPPAVLLAVSDLVGPGGIVAVEHPSRKPPGPPDHPSLRAGRVYRYGDTSLSILHRIAAPEED